MAGAAQQSLHATAQGQAGSRRSWALWALAAHEAGVRQLRLDPRQQILLQAIRFQSPHESHTRNPIMNYEIDDKADASTLPAEVRQGIREADPRDVGHRDWQPITIALRHSEGVVVGGLYGATMWSWLMIDGLWVSAELRGQGLGHKLLLAAEEIAITRSCTGSWLGTFDFQARGFYEKHGYIVFASLPGFPLGHTHFQLYKHFAHPQPNVLI